MKVNTRDAGIFIWGFIYCVCLKNITAPDILSISATILDAIVDVLSGGIAVVTSICILAWCATLIETNWSNK